MRTVFIDGEPVKMPDEEVDSLWGKISNQGVLPLASQISDRQFFQALAGDPYNLISEEEAEEAVATGAIPPVMLTVINELPANDRFSARMLIRGATKFDRANPLVNVFGASQGMDAAAIDEFWRHASSL